MGPCVRRDDQLIACAQPIVSTRGSIHPYAISPRGRIRSGAGFRLKTLLDDPSNPIANISPKLVS